MAGRPKRGDFFGAQEVEREYTHWYIDKRVIAGVREVCQRSRRRTRAGKPSVSQIVEGLIWWGLYCAANHRDEQEIPEWSYQEAAQAGLTPLLRKNSKLGTLTKDGHFIPDQYEEDADAKPLPIRRRRPTP